MGLWMLGKIFLTAGQNAINGEALFTEARSLYTSPYRLPTGIIVKVWQQVKYAAWLDIYSPCSPHTPM